MGLLHLPYICTVKDSCIILNELMMDHICPKHWVTYINYLNNLKYDIKTAGEMANSVDLGQTTSKSPGASWACVTGIQRICTNGRPFSR